MMNVKKLNNSLLFFVGIVVLILVLIVVLPLISKIDL